MADAVLTNESDADETGFVSRFVSAPDGLRLHVRSYGERGRGLPIVCLPGLTRNGSDFHEIATALARNIRVIPVLVDGALTPKADMISPR